MPGEFTSSATFSNVRGMPKATAAAFALARLVLATPAVSNRSDSARNAGTCAAVPQPRSALTPTTPTRKRLFIASSKSLRYIDAQWSLRRPRMRHVLARLHQIRSGNGLRRPTQRRACFQQPGLIAFRNVFGRPVVNDSLWHARQRAWLRTPPPSARAPDVADHFLEVGVDVNRRPPSGTRAEVEHQNVTRARRQKLAGGATLGQVSRNLAVGHIDVRKLEG